MVIETIKLRNVADLIDSIDKVHCCYRDFDEESLQVIDANDLEIIVGP